MSRLRAVARLLAYCLAVSVTLALLALRSAYGDLKESALVVGRELARFDDLTRRPNRVLLNGEPINVASATTDQSVEQVLDRFQVACERGNVGLSSEFGRLSPASRKRVDAALGSDKPDALGIMRRERAGEGMIACLVRRGNTHSTLLERLQRFLESGDLGDIGLLRYAYARRIGGRTHVVTSWTDGSFHITNLLPLDGVEPPGTDVPGAGRPEGSLRLLSAEIAGAPHSVRIYDCPSRADRALSRYERRLAKLGWTAVPGVAKRVARVRVVSRRGVMLFLTAEPAGDRSVVSVVETPR